MDERIWEDGRVPQSANVVERSHRVAWRCRTLVEAHRVSLGALDASNRAAKEAPHARERDSCWVRGDPHLAHDEGSPGLKQLLDKAYGYAVFPAVGRASAVLAIGRGHGEVFEHGKPIGFATLTQMTLGAQVGGQTFSELVLFSNKDALESFKKNKDQLHCQRVSGSHQGGRDRDFEFPRRSIAHAYSRGGMLLEASIGGQKLTFHKHLGKSKKGTKEDRSGERRREDEGRPGVTRRKKRGKPRKPLHEEKKASKPRPTKAPRTSKPRALEKSRRRAGGGGYEPESARESEAEEGFEAATEGAEYEPEGAEEPEVKRGSKRRREARSTSRKAKAQRRSNLPTTKRSKRARNGTKAMTRYRARRTPSPRARSRRSPQAVGQSRPRAHNGPAEAEVEKATKSLSSGVRGRLAGHRAKGGRKGRPFHLEAWPATRARIERSLRSRRAALPRAPGQAHSPDRQARGPLLPASKRRRRSVPC